MSVRCVASSVRCIFAALPNEKYYMEDIRHTKVEAHCFAVEPYPTLYSKLYKSDASWWANFCAWCRHSKLMRTIKIWPMEISTPWWKRRPIVCAVIPIGRNNSSFVHCCQLSIVFWDDNNKKSNTLEIIISVQSCSMRCWYLRRMVLNGI